MKSSKNVSLKCFRKPRSFKIGAKYAIKFIRPAEWPALCFVMTTGSFPHLERTSFWLHRESPDVTQALTLTGFGEWPGGRYLKSSGPFKRATRDHDAGVSSILRRKDERSSCHRFYGFFEHLSTVSLGWLGQRLASTSGRGKVQLFFCVFTLWHWYFHILAKKIEIKDHFVQLIQPRCNFSIFIVETKRSGKILILLDLTWYYWKKKKIEKKKKKRN